MIFLKVVVVNNIELKSKIILAIQPNGYLAKTHITKWSFASDDWHTPWAKNDLRAGGSFSSRMEAKDGSMGFEFGGVYDAVTTNEHISYTMEDGRKVKIDFTADGNFTKVVQIFDAESENSVEMQQAGWQAILDNFKKYAEQL